MNGANERLRETQSALTERGVTDVKFCFSLSLAQKPSSKVGNDVADFLDGYLKGRTTVVEKIGDAPTKP